jgi:hypothetical protein
MRIKKWSNYQHYKTRNPPWIRLHKSIIDDPDWHDLDGQSAKALVMLWLLASEDKSMEGRLPCVRKVAFRLRMTENQINQAISKLSHWLEHDASEVLADCLHDAPKSLSYTETETDNSETDTKRSYGTFENVFLSDSEFEKLGQRFNSNLDDKINTLSEYMRSKGKKYKDHYATILAWARRDPGTSSGDDKTVDIGHMMK